MEWVMESSDFVLVQGLRDTRATLDDWNRQPWAVLRTWLVGSLAVAVALLGAVWLIATLVTPDSSRLLLPGVNGPATLGDAGSVLGRNSLVLALHAFACVAGFIAGSSLPLSAERYSGVWRWVHDKAGPLAIGFVVCATTFSLTTQAYVLGNGAATLSNQLHISPALLLVGLLPHALPELTALFLPLAAWIIASRRGDWHELLAATFVTVAIAAPILIVSALIEVYVSPHLLITLSS
jgi:hypothetical protein